VVSQSELEALLETLARDQIVNLGVGDEPQRAWFRARVISHEAGSGRLVLTCYMDRPTDRRLEPGERVEVSATRVDDAAQYAPMDVEFCGEGSQPEVHLRIAGTWQPEDERRHQVRVAVKLTCDRARRWSTGAWHDLHADVVDMSSRGVGLCVDSPVQVGDRLSLAMALHDGDPDLRVTVELRHVRPDRQGGTWRAGGLFKTLSPADHERVVRFVFGELRSRQRL
jgi:PilZ domain-containing protein